MKATQQPGIAERWVKEEISVAGTPLLLEMFQRRNEKKNLGLRTQFYSWRLSITAVASCSTFKHCSSASRFMRCSTMSSRTCRSRRSADVVPPNAGHPTFISNLATRRGGGLAARRDRALVQLDA